jgi:hypothetical protein
MYLFILFANVNVQCCARVTRQVTELSDFITFYLFAVKVLISGSDVHTLNRSSVLLCVLLSEGCFRNM